MKLVSNSNWKRTTVQLVSLACGLALATAVFVGGNEILRDKDSVLVISPAAQSENRPAQQFGTSADAVYAAESWQARASVAPLFGISADAVYVMEGVIQLP